MEHSKYLNVDIEKSWAGYAYVRCPQIALVSKWLEVIFFKFVCGNEPDFRNGHKLFCLNNMVPSSLGSEVAYN